jgi:hypothetical protein
VHLLDQLLVVERAQVQIVVCRHTSAPPPAKPAAHRVSLR